MANELDTSGAVADTTPEAPTLNVDDAVADIAESLHLSEADEPTGDEADAGTDEGGDPKATTEPPAGEETVAATSETPTEGDIPPDTWRKEAKEAWEATPPAVKAEIAKREGDIARYVSELGPTIRVAEGFNKITEPYMPLFQKYNVNPWQHVATLLQAHTQLLFGTQEQKVAMFRQLATDSGIDVPGLAAGQTTSENPLLPTVRQLQERLAQLEAGVTGVTSTIQSARVQELTEAVTAFASDAEAHPFFNECAEDIKSLIDSRQCRTLEQAYEKAVWSNPNTRLKMIERDAKQRLTSNRKAETEHTVKARKALGGKVLNAGKARAASGPETVDQTLENALKDIHSREAA